MPSANRGKYAEGHVRRRLVERAKMADFQFMRLPDAHAGSFQPTTADYLIVCRSVCHFLEVKEVAHAFRLPGKNFGQDQRARLNAFREAGAMSWVLVCFRPKDAGMLWRMCPSTYFGMDTPPSWDMRDLPIMSLDDALAIIFSQGEWDVQGR